jgi:hypothetical protein
VCQGAVVVETLPQVLSGELTIRREVVQELTGTNDALIMRRARHLLATAPQ